MSRYIAFLRAVNVGGHIVRMEDLRKQFESLGFQRVETFIASGNVIFECEPTPEQALAHQIEARLFAFLGYEVVTFLRTELELAAIARCRPFDEDRLREAQALNVAFLSEPMSAEARALLMKLRTELDDFHVQGREVYWSCLKRQSDSKFNNQVFERATKLKTTLRGFNTIHRLSARFPPQD